MPKPTDNLVLKIYSPQPQKLAAKLRYHGWHVKTVGNFIYYAKKDFELKDSCKDLVKQVIDLVLQAKISSVACSDMEQARKVMTRARKKVGTHPVLTIIQIGNHVQVQVRKTLPQVLLKKPFCFTFWVHELYKRFGMGALIILNSNLRNWQEAEWSTNTFRERVVAYSNDRKT